MPGVHQGFNWPVGNLSISRSTGFQLAGLRRVILDEVQRVPRLFAPLKPVIDADRGELLGARFHGGIVLYDGEHLLPFGERLLAVPVSALWARRRA